MCCDVVSLEGSHRSPTGRRPNIRDAGGLVHLPHVFPLGFLATHGTAWTPTIKRFFMRGPSSNSATKLHPASNGTQDEATGSESRQDSAMHARGSYASISLVRSTVGGSEYGIIRPATFNPRCAWRIGLSWRDDWVAGGSTTFWNILCLGRLAMLEVAVRSFEC